jgi:DNA-binding NtrC family response regulator
MDVRYRLVGASAPIREIEQEIECAARSDGKVLITGETGVGKEIVARLIHQRSRRSTNPFVTINCAGVPDSLLESELFGHVRGSFTDAYRDKRGWLEQANGGTIFMDEVGEMSLRMQAILLRFLENGEIQRVGSERMNSKVDVRIVAATNRNLLDQIAAKAFREDLFYRLNVIHVAIPPLRDRKDDIPVLFDHFVQACSEQHRVPQPEVLSETMERLIAHTWPGNVRELKNVAERLVIRARSGIIPPSDLPRDIVGKWAPSPTSPTDSRVRMTPEMLFEKITIGGESFWTVVYEPFMARDLTRDDVRAIIKQGLEQTKGSYKTLLHLFNLDARDYKRFLNFLRKYDCHMPFRQFRMMPARSENVHRAPERRVVAGS